MSYNALRNSKVYIGHKYYKIDPTDGSLNELTSAGATEISDINGLQTALDSKQNTITNNSLNISHTNNLETELNKSGIVQFSGDVLDYNFTNVHINYTLNLPTIENTHIFINNTSAWCLSQSVLSTIDLTQEWTIIYKFRYHSFAGLGSMRFFFNVPYTSPLFTTIPHNDFTNLSSISFNIAQEPDNFVVSTGLVLSNNTGFPSHFFTTNDDLYFRVSRLSDGVTQLEMYDNSLNSIWSSDVSYVNPPHIGAIPYDNVSAPFVISHGPAYCDLKEVIIIKLLF